MNLDIQFNTNFIKCFFVLVLSTLFTMSCNDSPQSAASEDNSKTPNLEVVKSISAATADMANELKNIAYDTSDITTWHLNRLRARASDEQLKTQTDFSQVLSLSFKSGLEWLNAGEFEKAIQRLNSIFTYIQTNNLSIPPEAAYSIKEVLGMAYFRKAEIENCLKNHNEYSCLLPIDKKGQHVIREDAEKAKKIFRELLATPNPKWQTKWLYNVVMMALGEYPQGVEKDLLIDESVFDSEVDFPRFKEVGMAVGIGVDDISGSVVMEDFNNDGYLDLMVSSYGLDDQLRYFENDTQGGFKDPTSTAGLTGLWGGLNMVQADYDNDGFIDVLVLRGAWLGKSGNHPNSLLKNNGDGTFSDVTKASGMYCHFPTQTASWADYNNDGWVDVFIGNEHSQNVNAPSQLFHNNGDGTFKNVANEKGVAIEGFIKGCVWGDYNNDSHPDLYLSLINGANYLLKNGGPASNFTFTNEAVSAKTTEPQFSFPCWFFDFNQDGYEDVFVSGFDFSQFETAAGEVAKDYLGLPLKAELPRLYKNNKDGTFTEVSKQMNVNKVLYTMGSNFGDLNNDGFPDFYAATGTPDFRALIPNRMFLNAEGKTFYDVTTAGGFGHLQKGHGVAFGDLDNDGDQDVYNVLGGSYDGDNFMNVLFLNPGNQNNWINLKLVGTTCNKAAIGARVKIVASTPDGKEITYYNRVNSGGSFGANPLRIEQGLNNCSKINRIEITWPNEKQSQILTQVEVNKFYSITQGEASPKVIKAPKVIFQTAHTHHHH